MRVLRLVWLWMRVGLALAWGHWLAWRNERQQRAIRRRLENGRRPWTAHSPFGMVELGTVTHGEALKRAGALGTISYTDMERGLIFYNTQAGGPPPSGMGP